MSLARLPHDRRIPLRSRRAIANWLKQAGAGLAVWLPFFTIWVVVTASFERRLTREAFIESMISMGTAGALGIAVWFACQRWPWPLAVRSRFYVIQAVIAIAFATTWTSTVYLLEASRGQKTVDSWPAAARQVAMGVWVYAVLTGVCYAVQTRRRLHKTEMLAVRAEALAAAARLDALRARLNPHFLFNALHTLTALVRYRPSVAEDALQRLGDMLRYTLKESNSGVVAFSEEFEFTQQYLGFEQLRYEDRLRVTLAVDPRSFDFDLPPFCIQTLAENAVHHAIATRPEGGSIWITCSQESGRLHVSVRDDGPELTANASDSSGLGLRSVRERLHAAFGASAALQVRSGDGFEATFVVPLSEDALPDEGGCHDRDDLDRG